MYLSTMERQVPITRLGKFFGGEDYALDIGMGEEWLEGDMNFTLVLYKVDQKKTKTQLFYICLLYTSDAADE